MPKLHALLESALYVTDLDRAARFYRDVLGLRLIGDEYFQDNRGCAFAVGPGVLLLFRAEETRKGGMLPPHGATGQGHVAFRIAPEELAAWRKHFKERGVAIEQELSFSGEPPSLYFRDPDGNLLELAVTSIWPL